MRGSTANRYTFDQEGVFCRDTLTALYSFMATENLIQTNFNSEIASDILSQRITEARRAIAAYDSACSEELDIAALDDQIIARLQDRHNAAPSRELIDAYQRYQLAQDALNSAFMVIDLASRYRDIQSANLSAEDQAFIQACNDAIDGADDSEGFRAIADRILGDIMAEDSGLFTLELRSYRYRLSEYVEARNRARRSPTEDNQRKESEAFDEFSNQAQRVLSQMRQWQQFCQNDPELYQAVSTRIDQLINRVTSTILDEELGPDFPGAERTHMQERLSAIDQEVLTDIEGNRSVDSLSIPQLRLRYYRADQFSRALGSGEVRSVAMQFLRESLRTRKPEELGNDFALFSSVLGYRDVLNRMAEGSYNNNIYSSFGMPERYDSDNDYNYLIYHDPSRSFYNMSNQQFNRVASLAGHLYALTEQHNAYANSDAGRAAGVQPITFQELAAVIQEALEILEDPNGDPLPGAEINAILRIAGNTSDNAELANTEIGQQLEEALTNYSHRDDRRMRGANELVISPRVIHHLETKFVQSSAINGLVSYDDIQRWGPEYLPENAAPGDMFFVSIHGVQRVDAAQLEGVEQIDVNNLAGTRHDRDPVSFLRNERVASLKLAIARYVTISDEQVLMLDGAVTARLTHVDLAGINRVFAEGTDYIFRPGSLQLNAFESSVMRIVAGTVAENDSVLASALRKVASGNQEARFSPEEQAALADWLEDQYSCLFTEDEQGLFVLDEELLANEYPTLDEDERTAFAASLRSLHTAVPQMQRKHGLSQDQQDTLSDLATYLAWADELPQTQEYDELRRTIAIHDGRLTSEEPADELVAALRQAAQVLGHEFNEQQFSATYGESVRILRYLHRTLMIMASKYPPENPGWEGPLAFMEHYVTESLPRASFEAIQAPSQADFLMAGLPNDLNFVLNVLLYPELAAELETVNEEITRLREELDLELESFGQQVADPDQHNPLVDSVRDCQTLVSSGSDINSLHIRINHILQGEPDSGDPRIGERDRNRTYLANFDRLLEQLDNYNRQPTAYLTNLESIIESVLIQLEQVREAQEACENRQKRALLEEIETALVAILGQTSDDPAGPSGLRGLRQTRDEQMPGFEAKMNAEIRRSEIMDILGSDRFDTDKFMRLQRAFPELLEHRTVAARAFDWAGSIFTGTSSEVIGAEGHTDQTIFQVLNGFFDTNGDGEVNEADETRSINLSNLLPQPGEDPDIVTAKIALSQMIEQLPRDQHIDLATTVPVMTLGWGHMTHGLFSVVRDVPALTSGFTGNATEVTYDISSYEEMLEIANSSWGRFSYSFISFLALSGNERPRMNMSSQIYMLLAQSRREGVREHLSSTLAGADWSNADHLPLNELDQRTMEVFMEYYVEEILPQLNSPRLSQRVEYLHETNRIPMGYDQLIALGTEEGQAAFLASLPEDGSFRIHDSFNEQEYQEAARFIESVLRIVGEINQTRAVENIDLYPMTYFDPLQALQDNQLRYQSADNVDSPRRIHVIHYNDAPEVGDLEIGNRAGLLYTDTENWLEEYGPRALEGLIDEFSTDPLDAIGDTARGAGGFAIHFGLFMGRQIEAGFAGTWEGLGELMDALMDARNGVPGARERALTALERAADGIAHTTGAFTVFEVIPWIFYTEVFNEIENGNYDAAFGKAIAITMMTYRSFMTTVEVFETLATRGLAEVDRATGMIRIRDVETANALYEARMAEYETMYQRSINGRLGLRLLSYHLNPFLLLSDGYNGARVRLGTVGGAYRYLSGGLSVSVSEAPVQIEVVNTVERDASAWRTIGRMRTNAGYRLNQSLRLASHGFFVPRHMIDAISSSTSSSLIMDAAMIENARSIAESYQVDPTRTYRLSGTDFPAAEISGIELAELLRGNVPESLRNIEASRLSNAQIEFEGRTASLASITVYQTTTDALVSAWENPGRNLILSFGSGRQPGAQIRFNGQAYRQMVELRARALAANDEVLAQRYFEQFRSLVQQHNMTAGETFSAGSTQQLWDAFQTPANIYNNINTEILETISPNGVVFDEAAFLRDAAAGNNLGSTYRFTITEIDPQTGRPVINRETGELVTRTETLTGRQILEILNNNGPHTNNHGRAIISHEFDAGLVRHFHCLVNARDIQRLIGRASSSTLWGQLSRLGHHHAVDDTYLNERLTPRRLRAFFRSVYNRALSLVGQSGLPEARFSGWRSVFRALEGHPMVRRYAIANHITEPQARVRLAQRIFQNYLHGRTTAFMETIEGVLSGRIESNLSAEQLEAAANYRARLLRQLEQQGAMERGMFNRHLRRLLETESTNFGNALNGFEESFSLTEQISGVLETEGIPVDYSTVADPTITFAEDVSAELRTRLSAELVRGNVRLLGITEGTVLSQADVEALLGRISETTTGPEVADAEGNVRTGRVLVLVSQASVMNGGYVDTVNIELVEGMAVEQTSDGNIRIFDQATNETLRTYHLEGNTLSEVEIDALPENELLTRHSAEEVARIMSLRTQITEPISEQATRISNEALVRNARSMASMVGLTEADISGILGTSEISTPEDVSRLFQEGGVRIGENFQARFTEWLGTEEGGEFLRSQEGRALIEHLQNNPPTEGRLAIEGGINLFGSVIAIIGLEHLMDIMGVDDPLTRFTFLVAGVHVSSMGISAASRLIVNPQARTALLQDSSQLFRSLRSPAMRANFSQARFGTPSLSRAMGTGILRQTGQALNGVATARAYVGVYQGLMATIGFESDSVMRGETASLVAAIAPQAGGWSLNVARVLFPRNRIVRLLVGRAENRALGLAAQRGILARISGITIGRQTLGFVFGRALSFVGWGLLGMDVIDMIMEDSYHNSIYARVQQALEDLPEESDAALSTGESIALAIGFTRQWNLGLYSEVGTLDTASEIFCRRESRRIIDRDVDNAVETWRDINDITETLLFSEIMTGEGSAHGYNYYTGISLSDFDLREIYETYFTLPIDIASVMAGGHEIAWPGDQEDAWEELQEIMHNGHFTPASGGSPVEVSSIDDPRLLDYLGNRYDISNSEMPEFQRMVQVASFQQQIAFTRNVRPEDHELDTSRALHAHHYLELNDTIREYFNENGEPRDFETFENYIRTEILGELSEYETEELLTARRVQRLITLTEAAVLNNGVVPADMVTEADRQLGLVSANGDNYSISTESETYTSMVDAMRQGWTEEFNQLSNTQQRQRIALARLQYAMSGRLPLLEEQLIAYGDDPFEWNSDPDYMMELENIAFEMQQITDPLYKMIEDDPEADQIAISMRIAGLLARVISMNPIDDIMAEHDLIRAISGLTEQVNGLDQRISDAISADPTATRNALRGLRSELNDINLQLSLLSAPGHETEIESLAATLGQTMTRLNTELGFYEDEELFAGMIDRYNNAPTISAEPSHSSSSSAHSSSSSSGGTRPSNGGLPHTFIY
ncbi:MAG: hypothetical protein JW782_08205 [Candidatus Saganbacteria bacterium]|nr:hypothetical protein [Candidatus Saganbacteria bacterium]